MSRADYYSRENIEKNSSAKDPFCINNTSNVPTLLSEQTWVPVWSWFEVNIQIAAGLVMFSAIYVLLTFDWFLDAIYLCSHTASSAIPSPDGSWTSGWCRLVLEQLCWGCSFPQAAPAPRVLLQKQALLLSCAKCLSHSPHWKCRLRFFKTLRKKWNYGIKFGSFYLMLDCSGSDACKS